MTIAQQIQDCFVFLEGNWIADYQAEIGEITIPRHFYLSIATQWLGGYWEGDKCTFDDDSFISFEGANSMQVGSRF